MSTDAEDGRLAAKRSELPSGDCNTNKSMLEDRLTNTTNEFSCSGHVPLETRAKLK